MSINLEETVKQLTDFFKTEIKTQTVVGLPFQLGEFTCVPVIKRDLTMILIIAIKKKNLHPELSGRLYQPERENNQDENKQRCIN